MAREPDPLTLFEVAKRAAEVIDPDGADADLGDFLVRFEDRDEPVAPLRDHIAEDVWGEVGALDPEAEDPLLQMAGAVTIYIAFRRDEATDNRADLLRMAAEAEFDGSPPPNVANWLAEQGVEV
jgi:hypothetical protein